LLAAPCSIRMSDHGQYRQEFVWTLEHVRQAKSHAAMRPGVR
jgi:hypothetical protein